MKQSGLSPKVVLLAKPHARLLAWLGASIAACAVTATTFPSLLQQEIVGNFGTLFPVIPFVALLALLFLSRLGDLKRLAFGKGSSELPARLVGLALVSALVAARGFFSQSVELSGTAVVLTFYGTALLLIPSMKRSILPYAVISVFGIAGPSVLLYLFGDPLATFSAALSSALTASFGIPVTWQGDQFEINSLAGGTVSATIVPGCSSIISVTTFLALLALMHLDLKKDIRATAKAALAGVVVLTALNAVRILLLVWVGYADGANAFWAVHDWVGYAIFVGFYFAVLAVYPKMKG